jgi:NAD(P)-dependent dehydrogenase (short-subunit alcohol dehydrogenase family)
MAALAVVTGGGTGIGAALARALVASGLRVVVAGRRMEPLREVAAGAKDGAIIPVQADVSTAEGVEAITAAVVTAGAPLQFLVQNAAVIGAIKPLTAVSRADWKQAYEINVEGPLFLAQALLPHMASGGRILHIGSGAAHSPIEGWGAYCTTKAAFHMLYRMLDAELKARGVRVGSARPGVVDTPMQGVIRSADAAAFPSLSYFQGLKEKSDAAAAAATPAAAGAASDASAASAPAPPPSGALDRPENVAAFLFWLLRGSGDEEFAAEEWDIRNAAHHSRWGAAAKA